MKSRRSHLYYLGIMFVFLYSFAYANEVESVKIHADSQKINLFDTMEILVDKDDNLSIDTVSTL